MVKGNFYIWAFFILALGALCWGMFSFDQPHPRLFNHSDKFEHVAAFALVTLLGRLLITGNRRWWYWAAWLVLAYLLEYLQGLWSPLRLFDRADALANGGGVLVAFLLWVYLYLRRRNSQK